MLFCVSFTDNDTSWNFVLIPSQFSVINTDFQTATAVYYCCCISTLKKYQILFHKHLKTLAKPFVYLNPTSTIGAIMDWHGSGTYRLSVIIYLHWLHHNMINKLDTQATSMPHSILTPENTFHPLTSRIAVTAKIQTITNTGLSQPGYSVVWGLFSIHSDW